MSYFVVDVEADGPCPGLYSMVSFAVVKVTPELDTFFVGKTRPVSDNYVEEALKISGTSREAHLGFDEPGKVMADLKVWLEKNNEGKEAIFLSDNPAFDWQFMNYYLHAFCGGNPFGHSARRLIDIYCGLRKNLRAGREFKRLRTTKHTHDPLDDAKGNAEAFLAMAKKFDLKLSLT